MKTKFPILLFLPIFLLCCQTMPKNDEDVLLNLSNNIDENPISATALVDRGFYYSQNNDIDLAINDLENALKLDSANHVVITELGNLYLRNGNSKIALQKYKKAQAIKSDYPLLYEGFSDLEFKKGLYHYALEGINLAMDYASNKSDFYAKRIKIYIAQSNYSDALSDSNEALKTDGNNYIYYYFKSLSHAYLGELDVAKIELEKSKELGLESFLILEVLSLIEFEKGNYKNSIDYRNQAIEQLQDDYAHNNLTDFEFMEKLVLSNVKLAISYYASDQYELSKYHIDQTLTMNINNLMPIDKIFFISLWSDKEKEILKSIIKPQKKYIEPEILNQINISQYVYNFHYYMYNEKHKAENEFILIDNNEDNILIENNILEQIASEKIIPGKTSITNLLKIASTPTKIYIHKTLNDNSFLYRFYYGDIKITAYENKVISVIRYDDPIANEINKNIINNYSSINYLYKVLIDRDRVSTFKEFNWTEKYNIHEQKVNLGEMIYGHHKLAFILTDDVVKHIYFTEKK